MAEIKIKELASRIIDLNLYEAMDYGETVETISDTIKSDPIAIINFLVEIAEESQA